MDDNKSFRRLDIVSTLFFYLYSPFKSMHVSFFSVECVMMVIVYVVVVVVVAGFVGWRVRCFNYNQTNTK